MLAVGLRQDDVQQHLRSVEALCIPGFKLALCHAVQAAADDLRNDRRVEQDQSQRGLEQQLHFHAGQAEHFPGKECRAGTEDHAHEDPEQIGRVAEKLNIRRREPPQNAGRALFTVGAGQRQQRAQDQAPE